MNIHLKSLGCRLNEAEIENWAEQFRDQGYSISNDPCTADLIVLNSCAVTCEAAKKSRQLIRRLHRSNPSCKLLVTGCYASLEADLHTNIPDIDMVVSNDEKDKLVDIVKLKIPAETNPESAATTGESSLFQRGRNRAFIKIQDGCRYRCTFCIVTVARGAERSRNAGEIIDQINSLSLQGVKEIVLTGVHVGGYGRDIKTSLYSLIQNILVETEIPRIRLASVEPWDLHENFFELFANARLMPHMHLPLQSGDDEILKRMARRCNTENYLSLVNTARKLIPDFNVTTDVIVGFPGETAQHWQRGLVFIREIGFPHIHIFPFSPRTGTAAASMPGRVSDEIRQERCKELQNTLSILRKDFLNRQLGKSLPVLFENSRLNRRNGMWEIAGYTPNYIRVLLVQQENNIRAANEIKQVRITGVTPACDALTAIPV